MSSPNQNNPKHDPSTSSNSEFYQFVDPIGGLPLDDPEVLNRERRGRPVLDRAKDDSDDHRDTRD